MPFEAGCKTRRTRTPKAGMRWDFFILVGNAIIPQQKTGVKCFCEICKRSGESRRTETKPAARGAHIARATLRLIPDAADLVAVNYKGLGTTVPSPTKCPFCAARHTKRGILYN